MSLPHTPRSVDACHHVLFALSAKYNLDLPSSTKRETPSQRERTLGEKCVSGLTFLHFNGGVDRVVNDFEEWAKSVVSDWIYKPNQERGTLPSSRASSFIHGNMLESSQNISLHQRTELLRHLHKLVEDQVWIIRHSMLSSQSTAPNAKSVSASKEKRMTNGSKTPGTKKLAPSGINSPQATPSKRKPAPGKNEVFHTAPSSPVLSSCSPTDSPSFGSEFDDNDLDDILLPMISTDVPGEDQYSPRKGKQLKIDSYFTKPEQATTEVSRKLFDNVPSSASSKSGKQSSMGGFMRVSKSHVMSSSQSRDGAKGYESKATFSTTMSGRQSSSFLGGTSTAATSFENLVPNETTNGKKAFDTLSDDGASKSSTVALLQSEEFQNHLAMQLSPEPEPVPEPVPDPKDAKVQVFIGDLESSGPFAFSKAAQWPKDVPLRHRYEVERVASARGATVEEILPQYKLPSHEYEDFWKYITRENLPGRSSLLEKTKSGVWDVAVGSFEENSTRDVVTLTGELDWAERSEPGYLNFTLKPLRLERSHRFARRFGSDRFLEVTFPALGKSPEYLKRQGRTVLCSIATWLATSTHYILGRRWRAFYLEDVKMKNKKDGPKSKVHLFAVDGSDFVQKPSFHRISPMNQPSDRHTPMSGEALFDWHIPIKENKQQKDCKLFQRWSLGLSRTIPTVLLRPNQILPLQDVRNIGKDGKKGEVMNDGCALMSASLANRIMDCLGLKDENPSCFQGRIAGAKGIWMVDAYNADSLRKDDVWIQISDSQLKIFPHPSERKIGLDEHQLTFEVVSWSRELRPVNLNVQLLMVLQHGGIQADRLKDLVRREANMWYDEFKEMMTNEIAARAWIQKRGQTEKRKTRRIDYFPSENTEQAILLLDSGFHPLKLRFLNDTMATFLKDYCSRLDSLKIRVPESTYAYCIADPYGVLAEDEVHLGFSKPWETYGYTDLDGMDVLLGRNPAHLPNDIQKRRAVFKKELRHFKDIIVFPSTGMMPLAGMLSGGDYDGDQVWTCWDPELVNAFTNTPFDPESVPSPKEFGLIERSEKLKNPFDFDEFLTKVFVFNASPSLLGHCTNEHEKLCYYENGIASPGAIRLSHLLGHLADTRKTGYELRRDTWMRQWHRLSKNIGPNALRKPAYKQTGTDIDGYYHPSNIIDCLKFEVVKEETTQILAHFSKFCESHQVPREDPHLAATWRQTWERALSERDNDKDSTLLHALLAIRSQVEKVNRERPYKNCGKPLSAVISITRDFLQEVRLPELNHPLSYTWQNAKLSWQILLASCAYDLRPEGDFAWFAAGRTLCEIKVHAVGEYRTVTMAIYQSYKVNQRAAKKAQLAAESGEEAAAAAAADTALEATTENDRYYEFEDGDYAGIGDDDFDDWKSFAS